MESFFCYRCRETFSSKIDGGPEKCPRCHHYNWDESEHQRINVMQESIGVPEPYIRIRPNRWAKK